MDLEIRREFTIAQFEVMRANKQHHLLSFTVTVSQIEFTSIINEYHSRTWPDTLKDIHQSYNQSYFIPNNQLQLNQKRNKTVPHVTCQIFLDDKKMNFKRKIQGWKYDGPAAGPR